MSKQRKEKLKENLEKLSDCEHEQIYKIIREYTDQVTHAETGIFVSADSLGEDCFKKMEEYIDFCFAQKKRLEADEARRNEIYKLMNTE
jgi:hypothetical protein